MLILIFFILVLGHEGESLYNNRCVTCNMQGKVFCALRNNTPEGICDDFICNVAYYQKNNLMGCQRYYNDTKGTALLNLKNPGIKNITMIQDSWTLLKINTTLNDKDLGLKVVVPDQLNLTGNASKFDVLFALESRHGSNYEIDA